MKPVQATTPEELSEITVLLHDRWFDIESVVMDEKAAALRVPVFSRRPRTGRIGSWASRRQTTRPTAAMNLVVLGVVDWVIHDRAGIGWYDIDKVRFDSVTRRLSIESNFPLEIVVSVESLDVTVSSQ